jgi:hypothetical protein
MKGLKKPSLKRFNYLKNKAYAKARKVILILFIGTNDNIFVSASLLCRIYQEEKRQLFLELSEC